MRVKLNSLFTSSNQRFGRQWSYRFEHDVDEVFEPSYWLPAVRRLKVGDTIILVRMDGKSAMEASHCIVTEISTAGVGLGCLDVWCRQIDEMMVPVEKPEVVASPKRRGRPRKVVE